jgi:hypothetical protein
VVAGGSGGGSAAAIVAVGDVESGLVADGLGAVLHCGLVGHGAGDHGDAGDGADVAGELVGPPPGAGGVDGGVQRR